MATHHVVVIEINQRFLAVSMGENQKQNPKALAKDACFLLSTPQGRGFPPIWLGV